MSACSLHSVPNAPHAPIRVNGVTISRAMISREVQHHPAPTPVAAWRSAAFALVLREALAQEAARLGIVAEPLSDGQGRRETEEEARMRALVENEVILPELTEEECRRYYGANLMRFRSPDIMEASHILLAASAENKTAWALAKFDAELVTAMLKVEPEQFALLARDYSDCPSGKLGGSLGQITTGQTTPAFERALLALPVGKMTHEPVETPYGFHVIRLDRRIAGQTLPFEAVHDRIARYLSDSVRRRAEAQYVARLLGQARIEGIAIPEPGALNVH